MEPPLAQGPRDGGRPSTGRSQPLLHDSPCALRPVRWSAFHTVVCEFLVHPAASHWARGFSHKGNRRLVWFSGAQASPMRREGAFKASGPLRPYQAEVAFAHSCRSTRGAPCAQPTHTYQGRFLSQSHLLDDNGQLQTRCACHHVQIAGASHVTLYLWS